MIHRYWLVWVLSVSALSGCADRARFDGMKAIRAEADKVCGGPAIDMDNPDPRDRMNFRFRCEADGRIVGPFGYFAPAAPDPYAGLRDGHG